jgi:hypothetical protein
MSELPERKSQAALIVSRFGGKKAMLQMTHLTERQIREALRIGYFQERDRAKLLAAAVLHDIPHVPDDYVAHLYILGTPAPATPSFAIVDNHVVDRQPPAAAVSQENHHG